MHYHTSINDLHLTQQGNEKKTVSQSCAVATSTFYLPVQTAGRTTKAPQVRTSCNPIIVCPIIMSDGVT